MRCPLCEQTNGHADSCERKHRSSPGGSYCDGCGIDWPCDASVLETLNADLLAALKEAQFALLSSILFIEGAFPEPRSRIMADELVSYRMRELKARVAITRADGEA